MKRSPLYCPWGDRAHNLKFLACGRRPLIGKAMGHRFWELCFYFLHRGPSGNTRNKRDKQTTGTVMCSVGVVFLATAGWCLFVLRCGDTVSAHAALISCGCLTSPSMQKKWNDLQPRTEAENTCADSLPRGAPLPSALPACL